VTPNALICDNKGYYTRINFVCQVVLENISKKFFSEGAGRDIEF